MLLLLYLVPRPSVSSVGATQHQHQAITSSGDVHGNLDTKSVFRGAFSPDEKPGCYSASPELA